MRKGNFVGHLIGMSDSLKFILKELSKNVHWWGINTINKKQKNIRLQKKSVCMWNQWYGGGEERTSNIIVFFNKSVCTNHSVLAFFIMCKPKTKCNFSCFLLVLSFTNSLI